MKTRKRWFGAGAVTFTVALVWAFSSGTDTAPGGGGISLSAAWTVRTIVAGVAGTGNPDGADGVYLADINGDGFEDAVVGHEQGLRTTVSLHPGLSTVAAGEWPTVTLAGSDCAAEDAIFCDVDADGATDVVTTCETGTTRVEVHFAPTPPNTDAELLNAGNWTRVTLDNSATRRSMRAACADIAGDDSLELVIGGKDGGVANHVAYYSSETPRTGSSWAITEIVPSGWVMQMYVIDFDGDTDLDIVYSDRDNIVTPSSDTTKQGVRWLDSDGADPPAFTERAISPVQGGWKWFDLADWDGDTDLDVVACRSDPSGPIREQAVFVNGGGGTSWSTVSIPAASDTGLCQHITAADIDDDGDLDIGMSYFDATNLSGVTWQRRSGPALSPSFSRGEIAGILDADSDTKFDNLLWHDIDDDGDLDAVTTEQHVASGTGPGLGGVYFENPLAAFVAPPVTEVTCSLLTSGSNSTDATSIATAAVTPTANTPVYAVVMTTSSVANQRAPTAVTGAGLSLTQLADQAFTTVSTYRRLTVWEGVAATPTTEAVTFNYGAGGNLASWAWAIVECAGGDPSNPSLQTDIATVAAGTSAPTALAALASADSAHLCIVGQSVNSATAVTPDADFVELGENAVANGAGSLAVAWVNNQTDCTATWASADAAQFSIEVSTP